jgi:ABC-type uncharacterized transport system involved in gliding motility auxiliary subunit
MKQKNFETVIYSSMGILAMAVVMVAFYIVSGAFKVRVDITEDKAHTLSPGTRRIIAKLEAPVTLRYYCTQADNAVPPTLRTYAQHVEDVLAEFKQAGQGKIIIQKLDPKPDSDAEDSARLNGIEGRATGPFGSSKIYLGIVVSVFDQKFALPWLAPERERLLEYDISRAISRVETPAPPVVGIMSALQVFGEQYNPMTMSREDKPKDPWVFVTELKKDFTVKSVPLNAAKIDDQIKVLVVMHPRGISAGTQYAIDQFLMRGGKLLAFLDPHAYFDESHDMPNQKFSVVGELAYGQSSLDQLLPAWGLSMDIDKVIADTSFGSRNQKTGDMMPTMLTVTRAGIDQNDVVTSQIDNLLIPFGGAFIGKPAAGLKETVLVRCTPNSQLVDTLASTAAAEQILRDFKSEKTSYALAVHLTGKFKSAFPGGPPVDKNVPAADNAASAQLRESTGNAEVVLMCDTDMLNDKACVRVQTYMGHRMVQPINGNLNFVQSAVEQLSGDDDLISARSRASMNHPFTRLRDMEASAGKQSEEKIRVLEIKKRDMEKKISELQTHKEGGQEQQLILSPEQQKELDDYLKTRSEVNKELKLVHRNLTKDTEALEFCTKVINIGAMPVFVAASGLVLAIVKSRRKTAK